MVVRRAKAYSKRQITSNTRRSKIKSKNYIKAVPNQKVTKFNMGDVRSFNKGVYKNFITIYSLMTLQIRDMALESARQYLNNQLTRLLTNDYYLACKPYPHQVMRENKTFSGGSKGERVQSGMAHSFGTTMGRSAVVKAGNPVFIIGFSDKKHIPAIRELCRSASAKLPCKTQVIYEEVK